VSAAGAAGTMAKRLGVVGSGDVGQQLGRGFAAHGYDVLVGSRDPKKLEAWKRGVDGRVAVGTFAQAAEHGELVILATHGAATEGVLDQIGPKAFARKIVIDATNPLDLSHGMPPGLLFGLNDSLGERVQRKLPDAKVVKCFNTVANIKMVDPKFSSGPARMWICGNDADAKHAVDGILKEVGWAGGLDVGEIDSARWLEALVPLWMRAGQALGTWEHFVQPTR
jgi:8-hydroxy-5-deazaflavin:NADPH oxidoreductase